MWKIIVFNLIPIFLIVIFLTEIAIPIVLGRPLFGSFRKKKIETPEPKINPSDLEAKINETSEKKKKYEEEANSVKTEALKNEEEASRISNKAKQL